MERLAFIIIQVKWGNWGGKRKNLQQAVPDNL
jgi:hypothetical protein